MLVKWGGRGWDLGGGGGAGGGGDVEVEGCGGLCVIGGGERGCGDGVEGGG